MIIIVMNAQPPRTHQNVNQQTRAGMPKAMAMQRPNPGIIRIPLNHDIRRYIRGARCHELRVATLRVRRVRDRAVPFAEAFCQDPKDVAVQMHRVDKRKVVSDDGADGGVLGKVVDVPVGVVGVRGVAFGCEEEKRVAEG